MPSFPDAEAAEDPVEEIVGVDAAGDPAERLAGVLQVERRKNHSLRSTGKISLARHALLKHCL